MFRRRGYKARYVRLLLQAKSWKTMPMKLIKWTRKKPVSTRYDRVPKDDYEQWNPYHEAAFHYGLAFEVKYIGSLSVPRPSSRFDIVAAMRQVRYDYKATGVTKRKVTMTVSLDGVRVTTKKKKPKSKRGTKSLFRRSSNETTTSEGPTQLMHHPIYRIFYVSHDSADLKIFSYIARDGCSDVFKCNVFKSDRKSQAMRIVRTVGQAFEICHERQNKIDMQTLAELQKNKMRNRMKQQSMPSTSSAASKPIPAGRSSEASTSKEGASDCGASDTAGASTSKNFDEIVVVKEDPPETFRAERLPPPPRKEGKQTPQRTTPVQGTSLLDLPDPVAKVEVTTVSTEIVTPLSAQHELQLLRQRLEQEAQQTQAAVAQLLLLRDQLAAEQSARCDAQARTHQLLVHNKELLEHIAALVGHLQERERGSSRPISAQQLTLLPQKVGVNAGEKSDNAPISNGNRNQITTEALVHTNQQTTKASQGVENNNMMFSPCSVSPASESTNGPAPSFGSMSNEQIQEYLISKFQDMGGFLKEEKSDSVNNIQQSYQNNNAFPDIPPLANHSSDNDLANWLLDQKSCSVEQLKNLARAMSVGQSDNSACSTSQSSTSKDSTPDASSSDDGVVPFIMPLSNNAAFEATDDDGRVRIIVPVSPCDSASDVVQVNSEPQASSAASQAGPAPNRLLAPAAPITRTTSEKVSNRSELMTALRAQWTRHTTK